MKRQTIYHLSKKRKLNQEVENNHNVTIREEDKYVVVNEINSCSYKLGNSTAEGMISFIEQHLDNTTKLIGKVATEPDVT